MEMLNKFSEAPNEQEFVIVVIGGPFQSNNSVHIHHLLFFFGNLNFAYWSFPVSYFHLYLIYCLTGLTPPHLCACPKP